MKQLITSLIVLLITQYAFAQYEEADAVFKNVIIEYSLNQDGSIDYRNYKELSLQTHRAFNRMYGETFIVYNPDFQELNINTSYTIMANGIKVLAPANAFNEVLPHAAAHSAAHNHLKEMVVTHTGLEVGASIFLDYSIHSKEGTLNFLMGDEVIPRDVPVQQLQLIVRVPDNKSLHHKTLNIRTAPEVSRENDFTVYTWLFKNIKAIPNEMYMEEELESFPRVMFSTAPDMYAAVDWFAHKVDFQMNSESVVAIKSMQICADKKNDIDKMRALQHQVVENMNLIEVGPEIMGYQLRSPNEVWMSNSATEAEKAVLLAAMLRSTGIHAKVVATFPTRLFDASIGLLDPIAHFMVQVNPVNEPQFYLRLDEMNRGNEKYQLSAYTIVEMEAAAESLKTYHDKANPGAVRFDGDLKWDENNQISGEIEMELKTRYNPYFDLLRDNNSAKSLIAGLKADSLSNIKINEFKSEIALHIKDAHAFAAFDNYLMLGIPDCKDGIGHWHLDRLTSNRKAPLQLKTTVNESYDFSLELRDGYNWLGNDIKMEETNGVGAVRIMIHMQNKQIVIKKSIKIDVLLIQPEDYEAFRQLLNIWNSGYAKELYFRKD